MVDVEKIKSLCKERKTSLYALEKKLGLGNGTIGKWGKPNRKPNFDNVLAVANELGVPVQEIAEAEKNPDPQKGAGKLPKGYDDLTEKNKAFVDAMIAQLLASQSDD